MTAGDFNGDGRIDLAVLYDYGEGTHGKVGLFTLTANGNGDGGLSGPAGRWDDTNWGDYTKFAGAGDFNGDGRSDLALFYDYGAGHVALWTLTSLGGAFSGAQQRWDGTNWGGGTQLMSIGNLTGADNKADIALLYNYGTGHVRLWTLAANTTGDGGFTGPTGRWDAPVWGDSTAFMTATLNQLHQLRRPHPPL